MDRDVDASTGLITRQREASTKTAAGASSLDGLATDYTWDLLGRLKEVAPVGTGRRAKTSFTYSMNPPRVTIQKIDGPTTLQTFITTFDVLGRMLSESRTMPNGGTATRSAEYDTVGRKTAERSWDLTEPTSYSYDTFGRPLTIVAPSDPVTTPDGATTSFSYLGAAVMGRTTRVKTGPGQYTEVTTTEQYDPLGRLWRLTEPPHTVGGGQPVTEYDYDVGGRLAKVRGNVTGVAATPSQTREFEYDNRGFLLREKHPEKGTTGNGETRYEQYDARGHAGRRYEGTQASPAFDARFTRDRAERLKRVFRGDNAMLKDFEFGTSNSGDDWRNGKLTRAVRFNWLPVDLVVKVFEDYTYVQPDGLMSSRTTQDVVCVVSSGGCANVLPGATDRKFVQTFSYDALSMPETLGYPDCRHTGCSTSTSDRTVTNTYDAGFLKSVNWNGSSAASQITYHPTGATNTVLHGNSVLDTHLIDAGGRTKSLSTTNALDGSACVAPSFSVQPQSQTITAQQNVTLSASASGETGMTITYRWYAGVPPDTSAPVSDPSTTTPNTLPVAPSTTTTYWVRATNGCPASADSVAATLTVCDPPAISNPPSSDVITRGQTAGLSVTASGSGPLEYQWYTVAGGNATPINGAESPRSRSRRIPPRCTG